MAQKVGKLRAELVRSVTLGEVRKIAKGLVQAATEGDVSAARLLFDRLFGPPVQADYEQRIAVLESFIESRDKRRGL